MPAAAHARLSPRDEQDLFLLIHSAPVIVHRPTMFSFQRWARLAGRGLCQIAVPTDSIHATRIEDISAIRIIAIGATYKAFCTDVTDI